MNIELDAKVTDLVAFVEGILQPGDPAEIVRDLEGRLETAISTLEPCRQSAG